MARSGCASSAGETCSVRLEDLLGAPVDLVLADCVKPRLQPIIAQEVVYA